MILRSEHFNLFLFTASVFGSFLFCIGFFPFSNQKEAKFDNKKIEELDTNVLDRSVIMLVDALRIDMAMNKDNMPYLHRLIDNGEACFMKLKVDLPTVRNFFISEKKLIFYLIFCR
jgi:hypothetical protein